MKILLIIFVLFGFLFISQEDAIAQKKSKKIETWELIHRNTSFDYCDSYNCIEKVWITIENTSSYHVSTITLKLRIYTPENTTIYKRKHTIQVDLDPGETGASKKFNLYEKVLSEHGFEEGGCNFSIEILSIK